MKDTNLSQESTDDKVWDICFAVQKFILMGAVVGMVMIYAFEFLLKGIGHLFF
jgi:hypothetical protein